MNELSEYADYLEEIISALHEKLEYVTSLWLKGLDVDSWNN